MKSFSFTRENVTEYINEHNFISDTQHPQKKENL